jgi:hypothetical protein
MNESIKIKLKQAGVKNLKEFGYPKVTVDNITTDIIYKALFLSMLKDNLGHGVDKEINELIKECGVSND